MVATTIGRIIVGELLPDSIPFAVVNKELSKKLLGGNYISYGMYIYHMVWINFLIHR